MERANGLDQFYSPIPLSKSRPRESISNQIVRLFNLMTPLSMLRKLFVRRAIT